MIKEIVFPTGVEFDRIVDNKIILKEVEPKYPRTWEECAKKLKQGEYIANNSIVRKMDIYPDESLNEQDRNLLPVGCGKQVLALCQLLLCRNAYWGNWRPNQESSTLKYTIIKYRNVIICDKTIQPQSILIFPTEKMRDIFYENFKGIIEEARDLL